MMELGITIPLQKYLNTLGRHDVRHLEYGDTADLFFCWELHRIMLQSRDTLVAVNAGNRLAVVMCGMDSGGWRNFTDLFMEGLKLVLEAEGYGSGHAAAYIWNAGGVKLTKTHGRRSVAGLNRMDDCLWSIPVTVNRDRMFQPVHCLEANRQSCKMAGHEGYQKPCECWERDMRLHGLLD